MFDEKEYQEVFSQVRASGGLTRRVMNMKRERKQGSRMFVRIALVAAVLALMAVTVSASETVQNWFINFFAGINQGELSREQVEYIEENAKPILESQTHNGWTVELHSAIRDETTAYIVFHIEGPEDVDLTKWTDEEGNLRGQILFGNSGMPAYLRGLEKFFDFDENIEHGGWGYHWMDDGDGKAYTENLVFHLEPETMHNDSEPFGEETVYHFRFQDIVWYWMDLEYEQELLNGKYAGQDVTQFTDEENRKRHRWETLAEGVWEFEINFGQLEFVEGELLEAYE